MYLTIAIKKQSIQYTFNIIYVKTENEEIKLVLKICSKLNHQIQFQQINH